MQWRKRESINNKLHNRSHLTTCIRGYSNMFWLGWRERNQQDATNLMFIIRLLSQYVSGIIMPIIRRSRPVYYSILRSALVVLAVVVWSWVVSCVHTVHTAYDPAPHNHGQHNQCRTPCAVVHRSWSPDDGYNDARNMLRYKFDNKHRISCIMLVLSLHPTFMMHGHKNLKLLGICIALLKGQSEIKKATIT